jgi:hypothetical protein
VLELADRRRGQANPLRELHLPQAGRLTCELQALRIEERSGRAGRRT